LRNKASHNVKESSKVFFDLNRDADDLQHVSASSTDTSLSFSYNFHEYLINSLI